MAAFRLGFKTFRDAHPEVGEALEDEFQLVPGRINCQPTSTGVLCYYVESNVIHFFAAAARSQ